MKTSGTRSVGTCEKLGLRSWSAHTCLLAQGTGRGSRLRLQKLGWFPATDPAHAPSPHKVPTPAPLAPQHSSPLGQRLLLLRSVHSSGHGARLDLTLHLNGFGGGHCQCREGQQIRSVLEHWLVCQDKHRVHPGPHWAHTPVPLAPTTASFWGTEPALTQPSRLLLHYLKTWHQPWPWWAVSTTEHRRSPGWHLAPSPSISSPSPQQGVAARIPWGEILPPKPLGTHRLCRDPPKDTTPRPG